MNWLEILKNDMLEISKAEALRYWPPFQDCTAPSFIERYEHVKHVEKNALKLQQLHGGDLDVVLASVWVHDRAKFEPGDHAQNGADWAAKNLCSTGFPAEKVEAVVYAVSVHSGWEIGHMDTLEAKILWDADKLSHFGPAFFMDLVFSFTSKANCERENKPDILRFHETMSMDNFMLRLKNFKDDFPDDAIARMFYLEESKKLVKTYVHAIRTFYSVLEDQLL